MTEPGWVPDIGSTVWAKYTADGLWYTAEVDEVITMGAPSSDGSSDEESAETSASSGRPALRIAVTYTDYGNFEVLPLSSLFKLVPDAAQTQHHRHHQPPQHQLQPQPPPQQQAAALPPRQEHHQHEHLAQGQQQSATVTLDGLCYGHPWYIASLGTAADSTPAPFAPFPFPEPSGGSGVWQWQWRCRWPTRPPPHWR